MEKKNRNRNKNKNKKPRQTCVFFSRSISWNSGHSNGNTGFYSRPLDFIGLRWRTFSTPTFDLNTVFPKSLTIGNGKQWILYVTIKHQWKQFFRLTYNLKTIFFLRSLSMGKSIISMDTFLIQDLVR